MATKKNKNAKKNTRNLWIQILVSLLCLAGLILFFVYGTTNESLKEKFLNIWENTLNLGSTTSAVTQKLTSDNPDDLLLYVVDTGNSDSIILKTPQGNAMLIDSADADDERKILSTLKALDIDELDIALSTHHHADHTGSLKKILDKVKVDEYITINYDDTSSTYNKLESDIVSKDIPIKKLAEGETFNMDEVTVIVLNPDPAQTYTDANEASMVFLITYKNTKFLLTGDAEIATVEHLTQKYGAALDSDFLKVAHHGSSGATTQAFIDAVTPACAVITAGKDNDYGHPHKNVLELLETNNVKTFRTDEKGDIAVFSDGNNVTCKTLG